jgi:hypothetical protein
MLERYPDPEDWEGVRFSDEAHFGYSTCGKVYVTRRPWERHCPDCVIEKQEPAEKDLKRLHAWAAVGYNFKSDLHWYDVPGNKNGKMNKEVYRDVILEGIVRPWLDRGDSFVLEEDRDSGHGIGKGKNIVKDWKQAHGLETYFNCSASPDFSPIEEAWQSAKQSVLKRPCNDDSVIKEYAEEGWAKLTQEKINSLVHRIPEILRDCLELQGGMTGH